MAQGMNVNQSAKSKGKSLDFDNRKARGILCNGLNQLNIMLEEEKIDQCLSHAELLMEWNRIFNLSAIRNLTDVMIKHFLDSFSVLHFVHGDSVIDIGSGAGFPGIPIAVAKPECQVVLLDASSKKTDFLKHSIAKMRMTNVEVVCSRIQTVVANGRKFDTVIARALGSLNAVAELALPMLSANGVVVAMKGQYPAEELESLSHPSVTEVHEVHVPELNGKRHVVVMKQETN